MAIEDIVRDKNETDIVSLECSSPTNCGWCNKPLPLPYTDRRFKIRRSRMNLSFCGWKCVMNFARKE